MKFYVLLLLLMQISQGWATTLKVGITSPPNNLNPFFGADAYSQNINRLLHASLIDVNRKMEPICRACEVFEEKILKNGKYRIYFTLKNNLKFWDGAKVNISDVENSVAYFKNEKGNHKSIFRFAFSAIKKFTKISKRKFYLEYDSYAPNYITDLTLLKLIKLVSEKVIGAGGYKLKLKEPFRIVLSPVLPGLDPLEFKVVKDETTMVLKLKNKEIDLIAGDLSQRKLKYALENINSIKSWSQLGTNYNYIMFNMNSDLGKNENFRRLVQQNLNVENFLNYKLKGKADPSQGFVSRSFQKYFVPLLLEKRVKSKFQTKKVINFLIGNNLTSKEFAHYFKSKMERIGLKVKIRSYEWGVLKKRLVSGQFDMFLGSWIGFTDPSIMTYALHTKSIPPKGANRGHFKNEQLDQSLDRAMIKLDNKNLFTKAQRIIHQKIPYLDLWHPRIMWLGRDCLVMPSLYSNGSFLSFEEVSNRGCKS